MTGFDPADLTGELLRAARALLRLSVEDLADAANLGVATLRRAEATAGRLRTTRANASAIVAALDRLGVMFIAANGGGEGVRLKAPSAPKN